MDMEQEAVDELKKAERLESRTSVFVWSSLVFAFLQSVCTAVIAASGMQFVFGLGAFITAVATSAPSQALHREAIRLPMLIFALVGAGVNLGVLWQVWRLRRRPSAQWRLRPLSAHKRRMERWQLVMSVLTILLVLAEFAAHKSIHGYSF
jgi:heme/copper-type cytochrome/quinol oxidase subunit 2